jgi:hypothetical protein
MRMILTPIGLVIFGAFTSLFVLAGILVDRLLGLPGLLPQSAIVPASFPLIGTGVFMTTWSAIHFSREKGTPVPFNPPPKIVETGPRCLSQDPDGINISQYSDREQSNSLDGKAASEAQSRDPEMMALL